MIPHPVTTRRGFVTNARNLDTTFKIVLSGKRNQRRRNTRITVLMMRRKRRNPQNLHHQNPRSLHLTRRAAPRRLGHSLARKWTLKLNLRKMMKRRRLKNLNLVWRVWPSLLLSLASPSSTLKKLTPPTSLMKIMMTTLPPIASWKKVQRYSNTPPLNLVKMNLMRISSPATLNLLRLL